MDTLPLPARPNLDYYRKRAKDLVKVAASGDDVTAVQEWARAWVDDIKPRLGGATTDFAEQSFDRAIESLDDQVRRARARAGGRLSLATAQYLIARAHGFPQWREFADHVDLLARNAGDDAAFERAADAVVAGDLRTLDSLLLRVPRLASTRSARQHRATLLHYVAANGVEDFRQVTPANAVEVARRLVDAGAEVDATADTYRGGSGQTTLNLLVSSVHPARAGLQPALVEALLDGGAAIDGLDDDGSPLMTALAFGYADAAATLANRGAHVDNALSAAALGDVEVLAEVIERGGGVPPSLVGLYWLHLPRAASEQFERALVWAAAYGRLAAVELLLSRGVDVGAADHDGMTALHSAAANGHLDVVRMLVERGAPLEAKNRWGGTVLSSTVYTALEEEGSADHAPVVELLLAAGADAGAVTRPTGSEALDRVLGATGDRGP